MSMIQQQQQQLLVVNTERRNWIPVSLLLIGSVGVVHYYYYYYYNDWRRWQHHHDADEWNDDDDDNNNPKKEKKKKSSKMKKYPPLASASFFETVSAIANAGWKDFMVEHFQKCGRIYRLRFPIWNMVVIADVEDAREIYRLSSTNKPTLFYGALEKFAGGVPTVISISNDTDPAWIHRRKHLNLAFGPKRIEEMKQVVMQVVTAWTEEHLEPALLTTTTTRREVSLFDLGKEMIDISISIICTATLEFPTTRQQRDQLLKDIGPAIAEFSTKEGFFPPRRLATWILPDRQRAILGVQNLQAFAFQVMEHYRSNPSPKPDTVIDVIMKNPIYQNDKERAADIIVILFAGHDTTGYTLALTLLELAKNPQEQTRLRQSIETKTSAGGGHDDDSYLKSVIMEAMRLHPVVPAAGFRALNDDYITKSGGYFLPKGCILFLSQIAIARDPMIFKDPFQFQPSRWLKYNNNNNATKEEAKRRAMFPFALGKRNCLGQSLANAELYLILPFLISKYEFSVEREGVISQPATVRLDDCWLRARRVATTTTKTTTK